MFKGKILNTSEIEEWILNRKAWVLNRCILCNKTHLRHNSWQPPDRASSDLRPRTLLSSQNITLLLISQRACRMLSTLTIPFRECWATQRWWVQGERHKNWVHMTLIRKGFKWWDGNCLNVLSKLLWDYHGFPTNHRCKSHQTSHSCP